ncbi:uncharacterized protein TA08820 [Theileria annulata]|uniref:RING-type domain-containing protein n=1 Tax=Theileria annulata TaxID=5874 RepID=Q4U9F6_THEAN|nr:uncharacterized protein TA08820 [Theileria annulata]CAI76547.1 hypothetical protein, conserved [Theileria annulata]|eukprot:XP_953172.1 hypothetical protein, conserved [Theileria annulata]
MTVPKDFECPICFNILYKPVTTSCGHNFCKFCIDQAIDSSPNCPLCRVPLTTQYSPNILLTQLINERFQDEIKERMNSRISFTEGFFNIKIILLVQNSLHSSSIYNPDLRYLPLYYRRFYHPPVFVGEDVTISINNIDMFCMLQYSYSKGSMFIITHRQIRNQSDYGTIVKIKTNNMYDGESQVPNFPIFVDVVGLHRVELCPIRCVTNLKFEMTSYQIFNDISYVSNETDTNENENLDSETDQIKQISDIRDSVTTHSKGYELILQDFQKVKNINLSNHEKLIFCNILLEISISLIKRQIDNSSSSHRRRFRTIYGLSGLDDDEHSNEPLESRSLFVSSILLASNNKKWEWFKTKGVY